MKFYALITLVFSFNVFSHSANDGDLEGTWILAESKWNNQAVELCQPKMTKIYAEGVVMYTWYESSEDNFCNKLCVGQGTYELKDGIVTETITNHSNSALIGQSFSYKPNFMFDKKSFIQEVTFGDDVLFERWGSKTCDQQKCARIN